jgi:hypothetical protein
MKYNKIAESLYQKRERERERERERDGSTNIRKNSLHVIPGAINFSVTNYPI